jgi:hypothetical protein
MATWVRPLLYAVAFAAIATLVMRGGSRLVAREPLVAGPGEAKAVLLVRGMT